MKTEKYVKQLTRENTLLDRSLRCLAYARSVREIGRARLVKTPFFGKNGVTSMYYLPSDYRKQQSIILGEFKGKNIDKMGNAMLTYLEQAYLWNESIKGKKFDLKYFRQFNLHHAHSRGAITYSYWGEPKATGLLRESLKKRVPDAELDRIISAISIPRTVDGQLAEVFRTSARQSSEKRVLLDQIRLTEYESELAEIISWFTALYELGERVSSLLFDTFMQKLKEFAKGEDELSILNWYDPESLAGYLKGKKLSKEEIARRRQMFILHILKGKLMVVSGDAALEFYEKHFKGEMREISWPIKGNVASASKEGNRTKGRAKIIITQKDQEKMEEGDILVSTMTTPRLIAAVRKAKAIVTDEGGMTAHAAIVARELGIPCIVGTGVATSIIKDGDVIEVDTSNGSVSKADNTRLKQAEGLNDWFLIEEIPGSSPVLLAGTFRRMTEEFFRDFGIAMHIRLLYKENKLYIYLKRQQLLEASKHLLAKALNEKDFLENVNAKNKNAQKAMFEHNKRLRKIRPALMADEEIIAAYEDFLLLFEKAVVAGWIDNVLEFENELFSTYLRNYISGMIKESNGKGFLKSPPEVFSIFTTPDSKTYGILQEESLRKIADRIKNDYSMMKLFAQPLEEIERLLPESGREINDMVDAHTRDFGWCFFMYEGPAWGRIEFILALKSMLNEEGRNDTHGATHKDKLKLCKKLGIDIKHIGLLHQASEMVFNKDLRKHSIYNACYSAMPLMKEISERLQVSLQEMRTILPWEFRHAYTTKLASYNLKGREGGLMLAMHKGTVNAYGNEETVQFMEEVAKQNKVSSDISELSGSTAYPGYAKGVARIVDHPNEIGKVLPGDILIAHQTDPDILPAMKQASAFVTDIGGITCHAAIVSREMKKPCVVGTKVGSRVIRDGDLVEVDASAGRVRIIGRAQSLPKPIEPRKGERWQEIAKDYRSSLLRNCIWIDAMQDYEKELGIESPMAAIISERASMKYLYKPSLWEKAHKALVKKARDDIYFIRGLIAKTNELGEENAEIARKFFNSNLSAKSNEELIQHLRRFAVLQARMYTLGVALPILDFQEFSLVESSIRAFLESKMEKKRADECFNTITMPQEESFLLQQEKDLLGMMHVHFPNQRLRKLIIDNKPAAAMDVIRKTFPNFARDMAMHTKKYCWAYYAYTGPAFKEADFLSFVKQHLENEVAPKDELKRIALEKAGGARRKEEIINKLAPDAFMEEMLRIAGTFVFAKPHRKDLQSEAYYYVIEGTLMEIAGRLNISRQEALNSTIDMLDEGLKSGRIDKGLIESYYRLHVVLPTGGSVKVLHGKEAEGFIRDETAIAKSNNDTSHADSEKGARSALDAISTLKGTTACPGSAKGKVSIINLPDDLHKMKQGNVLVSTATTPSIVAAMRMASAIVTDEGGLTCHAAIVSRELGIPCVVGTKIATQTLRDGDIVEVDATAGAVRRSGSNEPYIKGFRDISMKDAKDAGGKGASLGEMARAGMPVPDGFVILASAFELFLKENRLKETIAKALANADAAKMDSVDDASKKIQDIILKGTMPDGIRKEAIQYFEKLGSESVAVRSSATSEDSRDAAWAGQLDTFLNTSNADLLDNIKRCFASLFTPRAIFYRIEKGLANKEISVAVVVQKMIQSEVSGIAFSVHPVTKDRNKMLIEAGYGLGEAVVSGEITPDRYVADKREMIVESVTLNRQEKMLARDAGESKGNKWQTISDERSDVQKLSGRHIYELCGLIKRIEEHYGFPCDIEWAMEAGRLYITQSRPITTL